MCFLSAFCFMAYFFTLLLSFTVIGFLVISVSDEMAEKMGDKNNR